MSSQGEKLGIAASWPLRHGRTRLARGIVEALPSGARAGWAALGSLSHSLGIGLQRERKICETCPSWSRVLQTVLLAVRKEERNPCWGEIPAFSLTQPRQHFGDLCVIPGISLPSCMLRGQAARVGSDAGTWQCSITQSPLCCGVAPRGHRGPKKPQDFPGHESGGISSGQGSAAPGLTQPESHSHPPISLSMDFSRAASLPGREIPVCPVPALGTVPAGVRDPPVPSAESCTHQLQTGRKDWVSLWMDRERGGWMPPSPCPTPAGGLCCRCHPGWPPWCPWGMVMVSHRR